MAGEFVLLKEMNLTWHWMNFVLFIVVCFPLILFHFAYKFLSGLSCKSPKFGWDDSYFLGVSMALRNPVGSSVRKILFKNKDRVIPGDYAMAERECMVRRH